MIRIACLPAFSATVVEALPLGSVAVSSSVAVPAAAAAPPASAPAFAPTAAAAAALPAGSPAAAGIVLGWCRGRGGLLARLGLGGGGGGRSGGPSVVTLVI